MEMKVELSLSREVFHQRTIWDHNYLQMFTHSILTYAINRQFDKLLTFNLISFIFFNYQFNFFPLHRNKWLICGFEILASQYGEIFAFFAFEIKSWNAIQEVRWITINVWKKVVLHLVVAKERHFPAILLFFTQLACLLGDRLWLAWVKCDK